MTPALSKPTGPLYVAAGQQRGGGVGFWLALAITGLMFGRLIEFIPHVLALLRPGVLLLVSALIAATLSGRIGRVTSVSSSYLLLGFTLWSGIGIPFSVWRGGAAHTWIGWLPSALAYLAVLSLTDNLARCRKVMYTIAGSMVMLMILSLFMASAREGSGMERYGFDSGSLANANMMAMVLLMGFPFCLLAARQWKGIWKLPPVCAMLLMGVSILRSGSRSGLVGLGLVAFMVFWRSSLGGKVKIAVVSTVVVVLGLSLSSQAALDRFKTILHNQNEGAATLAEASARASSASRKEMLRRSIVQTGKSPLFGVGMGMFMVADNNDAVLIDNTRGAWLVSHNGYTQLSSETGIPGALLYLGAMAFAFWRLRATGKAVRNLPALSVVSDMTFALQLSLRMYAFELCFTSCAYECYFPILLGLIMTFDLAARSEIPQTAGETAAGGRYEAAFAQPGAVHVRP